MKKFKAPTCCKEWMNLRNSYYSGANYYSFQFGKCGKYFTIQKNNWEE